MIVCLPGYCCQSSDQCISLKSCSSYRVGRLCGKCKPGYFQSFFTNHCFEEKLCKTEKFWALAITTYILVTAIFLLLQDICFCLLKVLNMENLASKTERRINWLGKVLFWVKMDGYQLNQRSESESCRDREGEEMEGNDELEIDDGSDISNSSSTAVGLIKILFFFYQVQSILSVYKSNRELQHFGDLKSSILNIFNLNIQIPFNREFHCPFSGMGSITKVWIKALFPVNCLLFTGSLYLCVCTLTHFFSSNACIQKYSTKVKPRLLTAILQLTLLGYSTLVSNMLSLVTCISLVNGDRILYIDGIVPCYQPWQYAILIFIVLWAIPLIYALHKLPCYMRKGEISVRGVYMALILPLPFAMHSMVRSVRNRRLLTSDDSYNNQCETPVIPYIRMKQTNAIVSQLLNIIEGPFRYKNSGEKEEKLSWEPVLLLQRIFLLLCHMFVLQPGMRSLIFLLFMIIFLYMNAHYQPFSSFFLNATNDVIFILLCILGIINAISAFIYEYGTVLRGPLVQLLDIFDYLEFVILMIFPVIAFAILAMVVFTKLIGHVVSFLKLLIAKCKRYESKGD